MPNFSPIITQAYLRIRDRAAAAVLARSRDTLRARRVPAHGELRGATGRRDRGGHAGPLLLGAVPVRPQPYRGRPERAADAARRLADGLLPAVDDGFGCHARLLPDRGRVPERVLLADALLRPQAAPGIRSPLTAPLQWNHKAFPTDPQEGGRT